MTNHIPKGRIQIESESPEFLELAKRTGIFTQVFCSAEKKAVEAEGREPMDFVRITATAMTWAARSLAGRPEAVKLYQQAVQLQSIRHAHYNQLARAMVEGEDATAH